MNKSNRIYLIGFMGCGKSRCAPEFAKVLQFPVVDTDVFIEHEQGKTIAQLFKTIGEDAFRILEHEALQKVSSLYSHAVISTGGGLPCFLNNMEYMNTHGTTLFLNPPIDTLVERLKRSTHRPLLQGKTEDQLRTFVEEKLCERMPYYSQAHWTINPPQMV